MLLQCYFLLDSFPVLYVNFFLSCFSGNTDKRVVMIQSKNMLVLRYFGLQEQHMCQIKKRSAHFEITGTKDVIQSMFKTHA